MAQIKVLNKNIVISTVEEWNNLSREQLLYIAAHWQKWKQQALNNESLILHKAEILLRLLQGKRKQIKKQIRALNSLHKEDLYDALAVTDFIFEKNTLTICPLPVVKVGFRKFFAPNDELSNITAIEFSFADLNFMLYNNTGEEMHLDNLIATIYRPGVSWFNKSGEKRVPFNNKLIESYAKHLKSLSKAEKQLILLWYMGCRQLIIDENPSIFNSENTEKSQKSGWIHIIMALSGDRFGNFDQTANTDLTLVLMHLAHLAEQKPTKNQ